eukprot:TRINITY_DN17828_c0_g1_i1.p1 TRINITY_DN17828_c0_g1~~TRINITY_DN17828_c0_g1_i1.p1  ORF type:complete len:367 (-),score=30.64 TRINITY_DN17828_c0_g1_i1:75-1175(-)
MIHLGHWRWSSIPHFATSNSLLNGITCTFSTQLHQKKRVFSGIQPTGVLHVGNYLGAIKNWVHEIDNAERDQVVLSIVDMHAITNTTKDIGVELISSTRRMTAYLLACGINPNKCILFNQSRIPEHAELMWILSCVTPMGKLNRMTQFKDKQAAGVDSTLGLFSYPVLQAADILVYQATHVPVGEDQKQHLELARDTAIAFNKKFGNFFPVPEPVLNANSKRIMSLDDSNSKMSKSIPREKSKINITDDEKTIRSKIAKAQTDEIRGITFEPEKRPAVANLVSIFSSFSDLTTEDIVAKFGSASNAEFKSALADVVVDKIVPVGNEAKKLLQDVTYIDSVLEKGGSKARTIAYENMKKVKRLVGFL